MRKEWYAQWQESLYTSGTDEDGRPMQVNLPGVTSTSHELRVALKFATGQNKPDMDSVLFVFCLQNCYRISGMNMNNEAYTAYSSEGELLLQEGNLMYVLAVDNDVVINNQNVGYKKFTVRKITLIYLFE